LEGFLIYHSINGGTGSGSTVHMMEDISREFPKKKKINYTIAPSPKISGSIVEGYNATLAYHGLLYQSDLSILMDNETIY
jgi:tubulin alpha